MVNAKGSQRFIHEERPSGPKIKVPTAPNRHAHQKCAQRQAQKRPSNLKHKAGGRRGQITIARTSARREASVKCVQNKPLNPLFELTSSQEEAPDARCLFGRGPDVPFDPIDSHCSVASVKRPRYAERSGGGSIAALKAEDEQYKIIRRIVWTKAQTAGLEVKPESWGIEINQRFLVYSERRC